MSLNYFKTNRSKILIQNLRRKKSTEPTIEDYDRMKPNKHINRINSMYVGEKVLE